MNLEEPSNKRQGRGRSVNHGLQIRAIGVNGEFERAKCKVKKARVGGIYRWLLFANPRCRVNNSYLNKKRTNIKKTGSFLFVHLCFVITNVSIGFLLTRG